MKKFLKISEENFNNIKKGDMLENINCKNTYNITNNNTVLLVRNNIVRQRLHMSQLTIYDVMSNNFDINHNKIKNFKEELNNEGVY